MPTKASAIYQLKVSLKGVRPPVWRRLLVPASATLPQLHRMLQIAMGWQDYHLHQFVAGDTYYMLPDPHAPSLPMYEERNERGVRLDSLLRSPRDKIVYEYDFGDGWEHTIVLEKVTVPAAGVTYPVCTGAARACPLEDSGGPYGYMDLLDILADPRHPNHREMREWAGEDFDPVAVDLDAINALLAPAPRRRR